jgi:hypothetical protein
LENDAARCVIKRRKTEDLGRRWLLYPLNVGASVIRKAIQELCRGIETTNPLVFGTCF